MVKRNRVMGDEQNGFRKDSRGKDNMCVVNEVIEQRGMAGRNIKLS